MNKKIILVFILCACIVVTSGCNFGVAKDALIKTIETMGNDKETTPPSNASTITAVSLTETIRSDNKTMTGNDKTQWVELYKEQLYPTLYIEISEITSEKVASFTYMSDEFDVEVTNINVRFSDDSVDVLSVVDVDSTYLVDILSKNSLPETYDNYYVFEMLKKDSRFASKVVSSIDNKYPTNTKEIDLTTLASHLNSDYYISSIKFNNPILDISYSNSNNTVKFDLNYISGEIKSADDQSINNINSTITSIETSDGKHHAYIGDDSSNLYVYDNDTSDLWLIYEAGSSPKEEPVIYYIYNNKLIYGINNIDSTVGFGIYDFKSNSNVIYTDDVDIYGIQNGILFLDGSNRTPANPSFTIDLNTEDYKITEISDIFNNHHIYFSRNETYYAALNSTTGEVRITIYNTSDNKIASEYVFEFVSSYVNDVFFNGDDLILVCNKNSMGHDYIYVVGLS